MRNFRQVPPASFVPPLPPSGHDARLMDATGRPIARHREATARTDEIVPRSSSSSPSSSPFSNSVTVSPCLSIALHNVFYSLPIPDLDCHQRLPRRLLHSRALSSFPPVSLSLSTTSSPVAPFLTSIAVSVSPVVFSIPGLCRRFPLSSSLFLGSVSVSPVIFSIHGAFWCFHCLEQKELVEVSPL
ncbi:hypothetical protein ACLOJK_032534 [Asimina triloba]